MTTQDWFMFILTFLTGIFIGFYVYVSFFKPNYTPDDLASSESSASEFSVIGKQYGGSEGPEYIHPSFRLLPDASFVYVPGGTSESSLEQQSGKVSGQLVRSLRTMAMEETLEQLSNRVVKENCRLYDGGIEYLYRITLDNVEYELDTCGTDITYSDPLAVELAKLWEAVENPNSGGGLRGDSLYDTLENFLKDQFDWQNSDN